MKLIHVTICLLLILVKARELGSVDVTTTSSG